MIIYIVQPGDTLNMIAERFNVTPRLIIENNPIRSDLNIFPGQILFIPRRCDCHPGMDPYPGMDPCPNYPGMDPCPTPYPDPYPMDPFPNVPRDRRHAFYVVQRGDTLAVIASRFDTTVEAIVRANNLEGPNTIIYPGQILRIPVSMSSLAMEV